MSTFDGPRWDVAPRIAATAPGVRAIAVRPACPHPGGSSAESSARTVSASHGSAADASSSTRPRSTTHPSKLVSTGTMPAAVRSRWQCRQRGSVHCWAIWL